MNTLDDLISKIRDIPSDKQADYNKDPKPPRGSNIFANRDLDKESQAQDITLKERIFFHVLVITYGWLFFLAVLFISTGIANIFQGHPCISDTVLVTLVSGTSLSVIIGMLSIILRHLFAGKKK